MREGLTQSGDVDCLIKGRKISVRAYASPRYDDQNKVIGAIEVLQDNSEEQAFADELSRLVNASHEGQLQERGKSEEFQGRYRALALQINAMLDAILLPIGEGNRILAQISNGKIDELIAQTYKGDHEKMKQAVNNVAVVLQGLQKELARLTDASRDGLLSERGKPEQFHGAYAEVVGGVNQMLDAILLPIGEGNRILAQISNGKIDELIAQTYKGDHEKMKQAVNNVAVVLQGLQKELARLTDASQRWPALRTRQAGAVPGRLRRGGRRRQPDARRHPAAHRRRQPHPGADFQRQDRRTDRADLQGRPRKDEAGRQHLGPGPAEPDGRHQHADQGRSGG